MLLALTRHVATLPTVPRHGQGGFNFVANVEGANVQAEKGFTLCLIARLPGFQLGQPNHAFHMLRNVTNKGLLRRLPCRYTLQAPRRRLSTQPRIFVSLGCSCTQPHSTSATCHIAELTARVQPAVPSQAGTCHGSHKQHLAHPLSGSFFRTKGPEKVKMHGISSATGKKTERPQHSNTCPC